MKMASLRRWVRGARVKGLTGTELVFELHVRRGLALRKVAKVLRLDLGEVRERWLEIQMARAAMAPQRERVVRPLEVRSEGDVVALREQVCVALWETVMETFAERKPGDGDANEMVGGSVSQSMMRVRMRALKQMGRLYGVGGGRRARAKKDVEPVACATREEIAEAVRKRLREAG